MQQKHTTMSFMAKNLEGKGRKLLFSTKTW